MLDPERDYDEREVINLANLAAIAVDGLLPDIGLGQYAINATQTYRPSWTKACEPDEEDWSTDSPRSV